MNDINTLEVKIGRLLALAEGSTSEAEAEAAMAKAQALASAASISLAQARMNAANANKREEPTHERIVIGERGKHINSHLVELYCAVAAPNDIRVTIAHNSTFVNFWGMPSDIKVAKALAASLTVQMVRFGNEFIKEGSWRDQQVYRAKRTYVKYDSEQWSWEANRYVKGYWEEIWGYHKPTAQSTRASFYDGFTNALESRLYAARREAVKEAEAAQQHFHDTDTTEVAVNSAPGQALSSVALALVSKKEEVTKYYNQKHTSRGYWKGGNRGGHSHSGARDAGRSAAARANLGGGKSIGGAGRAIGGN